MMERIGAPIALQYEAVASVAERPRLFSDIRDDWALLFLVGYAHGFQMGYTVGASDPEGAAESQRLVDLWNASVGPSPVDE